MTIKIYTDGSFRDGIIAWAFVAVRSTENKPQQLELFI